jgi:hypothetical protein
VAATQPPYFFTEHLPSVWHTFERWQSLGNFATQRSRSNEHVPFSEHLDDAAQWSCSVGTQLFLSSPQRPSSLQRADLLQ